MSFVQELCDFFRRSPVSTPTSSSAPRKIVAAWWAER